MSQLPAEAQDSPLSHPENTQLRINNLFDTENRTVQILVELAGDEIVHFWLENSTKDLIDILSLLPSRERILAKVSTVDRFSAAIDDYSKAILEWQLKPQFTTEDVLAFIHELGHAMDGVQIPTPKFLLRVKAQSPATAEEAQFFIQEEKKAQSNALKILRLLIRKKILTDTPELQTLITAWDKEYQQRIATKVNHLLHESDTHRIA